MKSTQHNLFWPLVLLLLSSSSQVHSLLDSGAPDTVCDEPVFSVDHENHHTTMTNEQAIYMELSPLPVTTCNPMVMDDGNEAEICVQTKLWLKDLECSRIKIGGVEILAMECQPTGENATVTTSEQCDKTGEICATTTTGVQSRCITVVYKYFSKADEGEPLQKTVHESCSCLNYKNFYVRKVLKPDVAEVCHKEYDVEAVLNNEYATKGHSVCQNVVLNNENKHICVESTIMNMNEECTRIQIEGEDFMELDCQLIGKAFLVNPNATNSGIDHFRIGRRTFSTEHVEVLEAVQPFHKHLKFSNPTAAKNIATYRPSRAQCELHNGVDVCAEMITTPMAKCTYLTQGGAAIMKACHCVKYNGFHVRTIHAVPDEECKVKTKLGDRVLLHYVGRNQENLYKFDSTPSNKPMDTVLDNQHVVDGWLMGLMDMCVGEKRNITIPSTHYTTHEPLTWPSRTDHPMIKKDNTLSFEVVLVKNFREKINPSIRPKTKKKSQKRDEL